MREGLTQFRSLGNPGTAFALFNEPSGAMDGAGNYAIQYNVAVYQSHPITQGTHTLRISLIGYSSVYFDYALYTYVSSDHCPRFMMTKLWNSFGSQD